MALPLPIVAFEVHSNISPLLKSNTKFSIFSRQGWERHLAYGVPCSALVPLGLVSFFKQPPMCALRPLSSRNHILKTGDLVGV